jgi:RNA polymerase sigma-70 factor (ECF subfamily)
MTLPTTPLPWEEIRATLHGFIRQRVADEAAAEDLLQEVLIRIHTNIHTLRTEQKFQGWIYGIARNAIIDFYRSRRPTEALPETLALPEEESAEDLIAELTPCIQTMIAGLPDKDRQALILTEYQNLPQTELATRLGLSHSGAKSRVQRAREKLKAQLLACCSLAFDRRGMFLAAQPHGGGGAGTQPATVCGTTASTCQPQP